MEIEKKNADSNNEENKFYHQNVNNESGICKSLRTFSRLSVTLTH